MKGRKNIILYQFAWRIFFSCSVTRRKFYLACKNHWLLKFIKTFLQCLPFWFLKWDEESFLINAECMELFVGCCGWYWEVLWLQHLKTSNLITKLTILSHPENSNPSEIQKSSKTPCSAKRKSLNPKINLEKKL